LPPYTLSPEEWTGFMVTHPFLGPIPAGFFGTLEIMEFGLHAYDSEFGLGNKLAELDELTAGVLIPFCVIFLEYTVDSKVARGRAFVYGIEVTGAWGGRWRVSLIDGRLDFRPDDDGFKGCEAVFKYTPSEFDLTVFGRFPGGAATGDPDVIETVRRLFHPIEPQTAEPPYSPVAVEVEPRSRLRPEWTYIPELHAAMPWLVQLDDNMQALRAAFRVEVEFEKSRANLVADSLTSLDRAFRLAVRLVAGSETPISDARPISPAEGGLEIIEAHSGSLEGVLALYGAAEVWAAAHPLSVATLAATVTFTPKFVIRASRRISKMLHRDKPPSSPSSDLDRPFEAVVQIRRLDDGSLEVRATKGSEPIKAQVRVRITVGDGEEQVEVLFGLPGRGRQRPAA